jgi:hypothetical protein
VVVVPVVVVVVVFHKHLKCHEFSNVTTFVDFMGASIIIFAGTGFHESLSL